MTQDWVAPFHEAIVSSRQSLLSLTTSGKKLLGYFCAYTPIEIIHACGFVPIRLNAGPGQTDKANAHLPDFICPFMKLTLEKSLNGRFDFLSGIVQGYSCDAACGMVNIWKDIFKNKLFHSIPIPYNDSIASRAYYKSAILELMEKLKGEGGRISESSLNASMDMYAHIRNIQYELYLRRHQGTLAVSSRDLMDIVDAGFLTPPEQYLAMLKKLMAHIPNDSPVKKESCPVLVTGSLIENSELLDIIESSGGRVVADDLCNGFRQMFPPQGQGETPMDRLIDRYMSRFPCPARSRVENRVIRILDLARASGARCVIFMLQKYCTPHLADYPTLSEALKKNGFQSLLIEMDESWQIAEQARTRLESFFEMAGSST
jgi:benzoyl-CoA reductase/2-hydroxyglutaryl-CoA dehydratase subunit BcrC/BadD/HgdB